MNGGMVWHDMACLIIICDCVGTYNETIIMFGMLVNDDVNLLVEFVVTFVLSCPCSCSSVPTRIFTTLSFQAYTYIRVMLLIVLYDGVMLGQMNWFTDEGVTTIRDDDVVSLSVLYAVQ